MRGVDIGDALKVGGLVLASCGANPLKLGELCRDVVTNGGYGGRYDGCAGNRLSAALGGCWNALWLGWPNESV